MEEMQLTDFATTFIQLPIVGLFIWVVFRFMKDHREEREKMATAHRQERAEFTESQDKASTAITELAASTREFHTEVREWRRERDRETNR